MGSTATPIATEHSKSHYKAGQIFEAKKPKSVGFMGFLNDRQILHVSEFRCPRNIDKGLSPEYLEWCEKGNHFVKSVHTEYLYGHETGKDARVYELVYEYRVQYDSPTVKDGKNYPSVWESEFEQWAGKEVTDVMPKGEWRRKTN